MSDPIPPQSLQRTPLHALHVALGAKMVAFAGYDMPVSYPAGILAEHRHCREAAVLFDVSHMGQLRLTGADAAAALETLVPVDVVGLAEGKQRYALFTNDAGGILDDLMVTRRADHLFLVVNAGCKEADTAHLRATIAKRCGIEPMPDHALLALQGPAAATVVGRLAPSLARLTFMSGAAATIARHRLLRDALRLHRRGRLRDLGRRRGCRGARARPPRRARGPARGARRARHAAPRSGPVPLRPRHRHDDDADRGGARLGDPEGAPPGRRARRRLSGRGDDRARSSPKGAASKRVGLLGLERAPVREGAAIVDDAGVAVGRVTSGTIGPSVGRPIALAYVPTALAVPGTLLHADVRGKRQPMQVAPLPFAPHRYFRG